MFKRQPAQKRVLAILDYLVELADLRARTLLDVDDYEATLWLADIPALPTCSTRLSQPDSGDVWIEARRPLEPLPPQPPELLRDWLDNADSASPSAPPQLRETPLDPAPRTASRDRNGALPLSNGTERQPGGNLLVSTTPTEVRTSYHRWRETTWRVFEQEWHEFSRADDVYQQLSAIHRGELRLGEEYELVLGVGLLSWNPPDGLPVRRHLITANANLSFDSDQGVFSVGPSFDGTPLRAELDMLDVRDRPREAMRGAERALLAAGGDPFQRRTTDRVLAALARALPKRGRYEPASTPEASPRSESPVVTFSPALLLRRRSHRGVRMALRKIRDRIEGGGEIPPLMLDLCELRDDSHEAPPPAQSRQPLYPLPVNREQLRVRELSDRSDGTLVQGPPGTGKTHTIANLMCDLLAAGNRVLVTAQTPRTLRALRRLLPQEIRPLCVHWLGTGARERPAMEDGVRRIVDRHALHDAEAHEVEIHRLKESLHGLRIEEEGLLARISRARDDSRRTHPFDGGDYHGTPREIARRLAAERDRLGFIEDRVTNDLSAPQANQLEELLDSFTQVATLVHGAARVRADALADLPSPDEFDALVRLEIESRNAEVKQTTAPFVASLAGTSVPKIHTLGATFRDLHSAVSAAWRRAPHWAATAMRDIFRDRAAAWRDLEGETSRKLDGLMARARHADQQRLDLDANVDLIALTRDGEELRQFLLRGGKIRRGLFKSAIVTRTTYLWRDLRFDGRRVDNPETLRHLLEHVAVQRDLALLFRQWSPHLLPTGGSFSARVTELQESAEILRQLLMLSELQGEARRALRDIPGLPEPRWHDPTSLADYSESAHAALADPGRREVAARLGDALRAIERAMATEQRSEVVDQITAAIERRDRALYRQAHAAIQDVARASSLLRRREELVERLSALAPRMTHQLLADPNKERWRRRLPLLQAAWEHARARTWLEQWLAETDEHPHRRQLARVEERRRRVVAELAAAMAWKDCFARMTDDHRRHLIAWGQAMRAIGQGTGRSAARHRREAQAHLMACRDAVPAWIMPLHRVYDTIEPVEGAFDVVIVDDASQCGQDALPLFYLAKRVIVVGDDQQIRPTPIGIDPTHIEHLLTTHLDELEHRDAFRPEGSLFDHAVRRFGERIVLREHFRCQPEIIRFSDELCYRSTPLIPVRRLASNRLPPLRSVYVEGAEREGKGGQTVNRKEGLALVEQVVAATQSPRYHDLTFGVICLQGGAQARFIEGELLRELGPEECERRRLVCGNPYSFQGDERDVVFLSLVAAGNEVGPPLTRSDFVRRFNVAASRARDQMWLFHSLLPDELSETDLRRRLLEFFLDDTRAKRDPSPLRITIDAEEGECDRATTPPPSPFTTWLQFDVQRELTRRGYATRPIQGFAGGDLDLVVEGERQSLAIECDDEEPLTEAELSDRFERQRLLLRAGWRIARVRTSAWDFDATAALSSVLAELTHLQIEPVRDLPAYLEPYATADVILPDPFHALPEQLEQTIVDIVATEQPVSGRRIVRMLARSAVVDELDARLGIAVADALRAALRDGRLRRVENDYAHNLTDAVYSLQDGPLVRPRVRGPRRFDEVPRGELVVVLRKRWEEDDLPVDQLFHAVLETFDVRDPNGDDLEILRAALLHGSTT